MVVIVRYVNSSVPCASVQTIALLSSKSSNMHLRKVSCLMGFIIKATFSTAYTNVQGTNCQSDAYRIVPPPQQHTIPQLPPVM